MPGKLSAPKMQQSIEHFSKKKVQEASNLERKPVRVVMIFPSKVP